MNTRSLKTTLTLRLTSDQNELSQKWENTFNFHREILFKHVIEINGIYF